MHRVLFEVAGRPIYTYGVMIALGILAGVAVTHLLAKRSRHFQEEVLDFPIWALIAGFLGARLAYALPRWDLYNQSPWNVFAIWEGGLSIQGGLAGGLIAGVVYARLRGLNLPRFADAWAPGLVLGQGIGRIGCFFNGDTFGLPTGGGWGLVFPPGTDAYARFGSQALYPTQLFEMAWDFAVFGLLLLLLRRNRPFDGFIFLVYVALWSLGTSMVRFWRGDLAVTVSTLTGGQVVGFAAAAAAAAAIAYMWAHKKPAAGKA